MYIYIYTQIYIYISCNPYNSFFYICIVYILHFTYIYRYILHTPATWIQLQGCQNLIDFIWYEAGMIDLGENILRYGLIPVILLAADWFLSLKKNTFFGPVEGFCWDRFSFVILTDVATIWTCI